MALHKCGGVAFLIFFGAALSGCGNYVERSKYQSMEHELESTKGHLAEVTEELKAAQKGSSEEKIGRYQFARYGSQQWVFDTLKGTSCIDVASRSDWQNPEYKSHSCLCANEWKTYMESNMDEALKSTLQSNGCYGKSAVARGPAAGTVKTF